MAARYKAVLVDTRRRRWRILHLAAGKRARYTGRCYRGPFARSRCARRVQKLNGSAS